MCTYVQCRGNISLTKSCFIFSFPKSQNKNYLHYKTCTCFIFLCQGKNKGVIHYWNSWSFRQSSESRLSPKGIGYTKNDEPDRFYTTTSVNDPACDMQWFNLVIVKSSSIGYLNKLKEKNNV